MAGLQLVLGVDVKAGYKYGANQGRAGGEDVGILERTRPR